MMILVMANVALKPGKADAFLKAANTCIAETRKEQENRSYRAFQSVEDANQFTFVEEWASQEALDQHMQAPHFVAFGEEIEDLVAKPLEIKIYDAQRKA